MVKIQTVSLEGVLHYSGFRVLTEDLKSLGLRRNPNIIKYPVRKWYFLPDDMLRTGSDDFGGIWVTRTLGDSRRLMNYMKEKHGVNTRVFRAAIDEILFANSYRIKTNGIYLIGEVE